MKVAMIEPAGAGGVAHYAFCLARALDKKGVSCDVLTSNRWNHPAPSDNFRVHKVFNRLRTNPLGLFQLCLALRKRVDVVHWQTASHPGMILWLTRILPMRRIPWTYTIHNVLPHEDGEAKLAIHRKIYRAMDGLIFHNQYSVIQFRGLFPECPAREAVIPFGPLDFLDAPVRPPAPREGPPAVLFFGNIRPYKGLRLLIEAFGKAVRAVPGVRLAIAGQALEPFEPYRRLIGELGLEDRVDARLEYIPDEDIPDIFGAASAVVLPYRHINQSGVLFLSMALGKAVIAARVGGIPEIIEDGRNGALFEPGNADDLAKRIAETLNTPGLAERMGTEAAADARGRYSWDAIAGRTIEHYRELTAG